jgi:putative endonuclease
VNDRARLGRAAEKVALDFLVADGFTIVGTNVRLGMLEVDVLARKGPLLVVVEVRTRGRTSWQTAFGSVSGPKRRRLRAAAERIWKQARLDSTLERVRVDVIAVDLEATPVRIEIARAVV